jgi:predicted nucleic acid-binding protein
MFLLDTNVISELRRPQRADPKLIAWATRIHSDDLFLSAITILEIEIGMLTIARRNASQGAVLRAWLENKILPGFKGRILPVDVDVARRCADLHVSHRRAERDVLIAATALVRGLTMVTRNVSDFRIAGLDLVNPWLQ